MPPVLNLNIDKHPTFGNLTKFVQSWQNRGNKNRKSYRDFPEINVSRDDGLLSISISLFNSASAPDDIVPVYYYVNEALPSDPIEYNLSDSPWIRLLRRGAMILLSDGVTNHYSIIWAVDFESRTVSFMDGWPDQFFLTEGKNVLDISAKPTKLLDGRLVHSIDFDSLKKVAVGFVQLVSITDGAIIAELSSKLEKDWRFWLSFGASCIAGKNPNSRMHGLSYLGLALRNVVTEEQRDIVTQNLISTLDLINRNGGKKGFDFLLSDYSKTSLPIVNQVFNELNFASYDILNENLSVYRDRWPKRADPNVFLAEFSAQNTLLSECTLQVAKGRKSVFDSASKYITVDESSEVIAILLSDHQCPHLHYQIEMWRRLDIVEILVDLSSADKSGAENKINQYKSRYGRDAGFFFCVFKYVLRYDSVENGFYYLVKSYSAISSYLDFRRVKDELECFSDDQSEEELVNLLSRKLKTIAKEMFQVVRSGSENEK